jgi:peptidoglycan/LPS O-acetylase OafA/YrhL
MQKGRFRFEIAAAYCLGIALPLFEVCRRRTNFSDIPGYIDDFIIGGLLVFAARSAQRGWLHGRALLVGAWGILCGGLWGSLFGQINNPGPHDISGLPNVVVVMLKLVVYGVAVTGLALCIRRSDLR